MKRTALSDEDRVSVAEEVMERSGYAGRTFSVPVARRKDAEPLGMDPIDLQREWSAEAESYVAQVLGRPGIAVEPMHWDLRGGGGQALTDGMNYIGLAGESVNEMTLLHEVAHIITRTREGRGGHGPEFQETVYQLYAQHLGPGAAETFANLVWPEGRSAMKTANSDVIVRGFCFAGVSFDLAQKYMNGSVSASDILSDIEREWGSVGVWWGTVGNSTDDFYSSVEDAREYASGVGDEYVQDQWEWMEEYQGGPSTNAWVGAELEVVLVGKRPQRDYGAWNPTLDNGEGSVWESTSFLSEGDRVELVQVQYSFDGNNWKTESVGGLSVTAHRTAASDLRVHLFDSEGHEMFLEPDFDGDPWTYHPKVMDVVRYLADVAQASGVYWDMDNNEFVPSTITDFKVYDGSNDVTHEIKEFPQLRGYYASRTAHVSDDIYESYYDTDRLVNLALNAYTWDGNGPLWELVSNSPQEAKAFFDSLDEDERRWNVAEVFENGGWDLSGIGHKFSTRTAKVSPRLQSLLDECATSETVGHDYALVEDFKNLPEEVIDTHPQASLLKRLQAEAQGFERNEEDYNLVQTLIQINEGQLRGGSRTAAEEGGVLPWTPSHNGYYWIVKNDDSLEAVTNDGVNRMRLYEKPWGWEWVVKDDIGVVEKGNFGSAMSPDAIRDRANDLLAEFDTNSQRRTRGPGRGFQDDYTQAPNELWGRREALYHDSSNEGGVAVVLTFPMEWNEHLASPEGTPPEQLHVTLGYFGGMEDQDPDSEDDLRGVCAVVAAMNPPFVATLGGLIRFSGEEQDAFVLSVDAPEVETVRQDFLGRLELVGREPNNTHGFTPHATLGYLYQDEPIPFDRWDPIEVPVVNLELWYGSDKFVFPLGMNAEKLAWKTTSQRYAERLRREGRR